MTKMKTIQATVHNTENANELSNELNKSVAVVKVARSSRGGGSWDGGVDEGRDFGIFYA